MSKTGNDRTSGRPLEYLGERGERYSLKEAGMRGTEL
jgi:hypothetical protein